MANIRFVIGNAHDEASLTATTQALPIENTQRSERALVWRSTNLEDQLIEGTLHTGKVISCLALLHHNLGANGLRQIEMFNGDELVYDSGPVDVALLLPAGIWRAGIDPWHATFNDRLPTGLSAAILWLPQPTIITRYRIRVSDYGNPNGYLQIGRILLGDVFSPQFNINFAPKITWQESGDHKITEGGSLRTLGRGDLRRKLSLNLNWLNDADRSQLITQMGQAGLGTDVLISLYPTSSSVMQQLEGTLLARREQSLTTTHNLPGNWQLPLTFIEV